MKLINTSLSGLTIAALASQVAGDGYQCPLMMPQEVTALKFAHAIQSWLSMYYEKNNGMAEGSDFSMFPNASMVQMNGETLGDNLATNMAGLGKQAKLAVQALEMLGMGHDLSSDCDWTYPPGLQESAKSYYMSSSFLEASLCGAFIGLGDYVQNPAAAFLMARISAEHGIHGSYLRSYMSPVSFMPDSMALTPAFTPEHLLMEGDGTASRGNVGHLGKWISNDCLKLPEAPCGANVMIGNLTASLSGNGVSNGNGMGSNATGGRWGGNGTSGQNGGSGAGGMNSTGDNAFTGGAASVGISSFVVAACVGLTASLMI